MDFCLGGLGGQCLVYTCPPKAFVGIELFLGEGIRSIKYA